jgi:hypothetical protein
MSKAWSMAKLGEVLNTLAFDFIGHRILGRKEGLLTIRRCILSHREDNKGALLCSSLAI